MAIEQTLDPLKLKLALQLTALDESVRYSYVLSLSTSLVYDAMVQLNELLTKQVSNTTIFDHLGKHKTMIISRKC